MTTEAEKEGLTLAFELLTILKSDENSRNGLEMGHQAFMKNIAPLLSLPMIGELERKEFDEKVKLLMEKMRDELPVVQSKAAVILMELFTVAELRALIDLYKSPLGVLMVEKMPQFQKQMMEISVSMSQRLAQEILGQLEEVTRASA